MLFALICTDDPQQGLARRQANREAHLVYLEALGDAMVAAGPFMTDDGAEPRGSLVVVRAQNMTEARAIADNDPYAKAGVFASIDIRAWKWLFGAPEGDEI